MIYDRYKGSCTLDAVCGLGFRVLMKYCRWCFAAARSHNYLNPVLVRPSILANHDYSCFGPLNSILASKVLFLSPDIYIYTHIITLNPRFEGAMGAPAGTISHVHSLKAQSLQSKQ